MLSARALAIFNYGLKYYDWNLDSEITIKIGPCKFMLHSEIINVLSTIRENKFNKFKLNAMWCCIFRSLSHLKRVWWLDKESILHTWFCLVSRNNKISSNKLGQIGVGSHQAWSLCTGNERWKQWIAIRCHWKHLLGAHIIQQKLFTHFHLNSSSMEPYIYTHAQHTFA